MMAGDIITRAEAKYIEALEDIHEYLEEALFQGTLGEARPALVALVERCTALKEKTE